MRVLLTTNAAMGHFAPLAPTAQALLAAGHEVRIGCPAAFAGTVERAGFEALPCVVDPVEVAIAPPPTSPDRPTRLWWAITISWPSVARGWVRSLLDEARSWRPDVVVAEPVEFAGRVVAAALGVPLVEHGWGFSLPAGRTEPAMDGIRDLYTAAGSAPVAPSLTVDLGLDALQTPDADRVARYRYHPWPQPGEPLPEPDGRPRVLVTLGTFDHAGAAERIRVVAAGAADCGAQVIAVLGNPDRHSDDDFPDGVTVLEWVDVAAAVATSDLVVHHGGAGMSWTTLVAGRPAVVTPQAADQFRNADSLVGAGVAHRLDLASAATSIRQALDDPGLAARARSVAAENAALPDVDQLAAHITSVG